MAATGLPKPQPDHHIRMARFARAIMESMTDITRKLDIILGTYMTLCSPSYDFPTSVSEQLIRS